MPSPLPQNFSSWDSLLKYYRRGGAERWTGWMFRGQARARWPLESSLERAAIRRFGLERKDLAELERKMVRDFQRQAHQFPIDAPEEGDRLGWLALMQHWGAPTRLLDWSYSFYAALFFAIADATPGQVCTVWAIDYRWCGKRIRAMARAARHSPLPRSTEQLLFLRPPLAGLYPVNPFRLHQRLIVQQGAFLACGDVKHTFLANLRKMDPPKASPLRRFNLRCSRRFLTDALRDLRRMNLTHASLFPGLEGLAKHIGNMIPVLHKLPDDDSAQ